MEIRGGVGWRQWGASCAVLGTLALAVVCAALSARWIDTAFPGFFIMQNRVVASVSLPHWPVTDRTDIYQAQIVAANAQPVQTSSQLYALVRELPIGTPVTYTLEKHGQTFQVALPSRLFTFKDYGLLFGAYIFVGLAFALSGIGVWFFTPSAPVSRAFLITGGALGLFALTGADLYAPHWFFRLHVLGEALVPAGLLHLTLVFPIDRLSADRLSHFRPFILAALYSPVLALCLTYQVLLFTPTSYSLLHHVSEGATGLVGLIFLSKILWDYWHTDSPLVLQRIRVVLLGCVCGYAFPSVLMLASGAMGGSIAVNYTAFTGALFPLSLGYAIVKHDLFEIDAMLKRGVYYLVVTALLTLSYLAIITVLNLTLRSAAFAQSPLFPLLFAFLVALCLNPLKEVLQTGIDRVFFRLQYNPKKVIEETSAALATTLQLDAILALIWRTIGETLGVQQGGLFLRVPHDNQYALLYPRTDSQESVPASDGWIQLLHHNGRAITVSELEGDRKTAVSLAAEHGQPFRSTELCIPLMLKSDLIGFIALGRKASGASFSVDDITFLSTLANQSTLSIANALAYQEIQDLNTGLEKKVEQRTHALAQANSEIQRSFSQLEHAYLELQSSKESLVRAEKMAAFGRMTAGMAHEMNTPLGSALNGLDLIQDLVKEYAMSIDNPQVNADDHKEIAAEMTSLATDCRTWVEKATQYIRSLKTQARGMKGSTEQDFSLPHVIKDVELLLAHRLRLAQCTLTVSCDTADSVLRGDPSKFSQILTNLIGNAIDAHHDAGKKAGEIQVTVAKYTDWWEIRISDQGCGIQPENLERIFEEFFSTKPQGIGTGLGLPIVRDLIATFFGGSIHAESILGQGSTFIIRLPDTRQERTPDADSEAAPVSAQSLQSLQSLIDQAAIG